MGKNLLVNNIFLADCVKTYQMQSHDPSEISWSNDIPESTM